MTDYIIEKMADVGCGAGDVRIAKQDCDGMSKDQKDILDCWYNNGVNIPVSARYQSAADRLKEQYSDDDLTVLGAYVSARRNIEEY